jgi:hypothetical protein
MTTGIKDYMDEGTREREREGNREEVEEKAVPS